MEPANYRHDVGSNTFKKWLNGLTARVRTSRGGWGFYRDDTFTEGSPFVLSADTPTQLPFNKDTALEDHLPQGVSTFLEEDSNGAFIPGIANSALIITLGMKVKPASNNAGLEVWFDIDGSVGEVFRDGRRLQRGNGVEQPVSITWAVFQGDTWAQNGADIYVECTHNADLYGLEMVITRTFCP